jgi:hypothetical protein
MLQTTLPAMPRHSRLRHPPGIYWAPGDLHGCETLMAIAPNGEMTMRTVERGSDGSEEIGQLDTWLRGHGFTPDAGGPSLFVL